jgi:hypothetical protein
MFLGMNNLSHLTQPPLNNQILEESVITQFIKYESMFSKCIELEVTISAAEKKKFLVKSLPTELQ